MKEARIEDLPYQALETEIVGAEMNEDIEKEGKGLSEMHLDHTRH